MLAVPAIVTAHVRTWSRVRLQGPRLRRKSAGLLIPALVAATLLCSAPSRCQPSDNDLWPEGLQGKPVEIVDQQLAPQVDESKQNVADLSSSDRWTREFAEDRILAVRNQVISHLTALLQQQEVDTSFRGPLYRAVELLGRLRAPEAVYVLAQRLTYLPPQGDSVIIRAGSSECYYPCARALAEIGQPAIDPMVGVISDIHLKDELKTRLALWVIMEVEGKDQAAHRFETLAKNTSDPQFRERYESAKRYILSYEPDRTSPYTPPAVSGDQPRSKGTDSAGE